MGVFILGITAFGAFFYSFVLLRHARRIEDVPTSNIRSAHQGYVELEGVTQPADDSLLSSPLSQTPCVWWSYEIRKRAWYSKNSWNTIERKTSEAEFYLEDNTGRCLINPTGAKVQAPTGVAWTGSTAWPSGPPPAGSKSPAPDNSRMKKKSRADLYNYSEQLILPASQLYVLGLFKTRSVTPGHPQDSKLQQEHKAQSTEGQHTLSRPELTNQPYLISGMSQKNLIRNLRGAAGFFFGYFVIGGAISIWQLIEMGLLRD